MFTHKNATSHGIDISKTRLDDIDREVIAFALGYKGRKVAVDIGCGSGRVSIILALMGFEVWLYDSDDLEEYYEKVGDALQISERLNFIRCDIRDIQVSHNIIDSKKGGSGGGASAVLPDDIVIALSQRTLHHVEYGVAKNILEIIRRKMIVGGKLFLSVSGLDCKFAYDYTCRDAPLENRFCGVGNVGKEIYSITDKVCLYTQVEIVSMIKSVGLDIKSAETSTFGNHRVIAVKE